jgi:hypothetical protein
MSLRKITLDENTELFFLIGWYSEYPVPGTNFCKILPGLREIILAGWRMSCQHYQASPFIVYRVAATEIQKSDLKLNAGCTKHLQEFQVGLDKTVCPNIQSIIVTL